MDELQDEMPIKEKTIETLVRLQERQFSLVKKADQLTARAAHLQRVMDTENQRVKRRRDAHDKILLGSLMMMVGLQRFQILPTGEPIVVDIAVNHPALRDDALSFDKDLLIGALLKLSAQLSDDETTTSEQWDLIRAAGAAFRRLPKSGRRRSLISSVPDICIKK